MSNPKSSLMKLSDQQIIEKVLTLKGWKRNTDANSSCTLIYAPGRQITIKNFLIQPNGCSHPLSPGILTSLDACHFTFENDAPSEYWDAIDKRDDAKTRCLKFIVYSKANELDPQGTT